MHTKHPLKKKKHVINAMFNYCGGKVKKKISNILMNQIMYLNRACREMSGHLQNIEDERSAIEKLYSRADLHFSMEGFIHCSISKDAFLNVLSDVFTTYIPRGMNGFMIRKRSKRSKKSLRSPLARI